ncbi:hypothetical protein GVX82_00420 [Patescibacteria group bacterium]|jgi:hypothetical protein|nr:hypothetical protein [Patescibacteria group bacterium]
MLESEPTPAQERADRQRDAFAHYLKEHGVPLSEFEAAYERLWGTEEDPQNDPPLLSEMRRLVRAGFPRNGFVPLLEHMRTVEHIEGHFADFVETLPTSDREKAVLKSIREGRVGQLALYHITPQGERISGAHLYCAAETPEEQADLLMKLKAAVGEMPEGVSLEVEFSEA